MRQMSPRDIMYNIVTIGNTVVWYVGKLLKGNPKSSHHK